MKRLLAIVLVVLMAMPFALLASAADAPPAEPVVATGTPVVYIGHDSVAKQDGSAIDKMFSSKGWAAGANGIYDKAVDGAIFVIGQKGYVGAAKAEIKPTKPVVFTALDPATGNSTIVKNPDGSYNTDAASPGQLGMFMKDTSSSGTDEINSLFIQGPVIFENTAILQRNATTGIYHVQEGGSLVIKETCDILFGASGTETPKLVVDEGGYAYLHNIGFSSYTGKGTIVLDKDLVKTGKVTATTFADFEGKIVAQDGSDPFATGDTGDQGNQGGNDNAGTGDMTWVAAAVASIAVMGCAVVVAKKRA